MPEHHHPDYLRVQIDPVDESLLRTLAEENDCSMEEQAAVLLAAALERMARHIVEQSESHQTQ